MYVNADLMVEGLTITESLAVNRGLDDPIDVFSLFDLIKNTLRETSSSFALKQLQLREAQASAQERQSVFRENVELQKTLYAMHIDGDLHEGLARAEDAVAEIVHGFSKLLAEEANG